MTARSLAASAYVRSLQAATPALQDRTSRIRKTIGACGSLPSAALPPLEMMNVIGSPDAAHFRATMTDLFHELALRGDIAPDHNVLDLGCGCGRLAIPFATHLEGGTYTGVDVWRTGLDWCRRNIQSEAANLRFIERQAANNYYFGPRDTETRNSFHLAELKREEIDFAFAVSLFTHLQERDCRAYASELARVLKRSGCAYLTCFIIDEFFFDLVRRTGLHQAVRQEEPGCYYAYEGQDFFAGYTFQTWTRLLEDSGLRIVGFDPGRWAEKPGALHYQDTFMVVPSGYRRD